MSPPRKSHNKRKAAITLASLSLAVLALSTPTGADAKYFSKGWDPSAPTDKAIKPASREYNPNAPRGRDIHPPTDGSNGWKLSDLDVGGPEVKRGPRTGQKGPPPSQAKGVPSLTGLLSDKFASMTGFNVSAAYEKAADSERISRVNDTLEGIVRLSDENWESEVVLEEFVDGVKEEDRVWMMLLHGPNRDIHSVLFNQAITNASIHRLAQSELLPEGEIDMPEVKFAKMDYMTESSLPTSWVVMRAPQLMFITKRGHELRFLGTRNIRPDGDIFYRMMKEQAWKEVPVWESSLAPGGSNAWMVKLYQWANAGWTRLTEKVPSWALAVIIGLISQQVIGWLHKPDAKQKDLEARQAALKVGIRRAAEIKAAAGTEREQEAGQAATGSNPVLSSGKGAAVKRKNAKGAKKGVDSSSSNDGVEVTVEKRTA